MKIWEAVPVRGGARQRQVSMVDFEALLARVEKLEASATVDKTTKRGRPAKEESNDSDQ